MRYQIIIAKVNRNDKELMRELWKIPTHLKQVQGKKYEILGSVSGSEYLSIAQVCRFFLSQNLIQNPLKLFYNIMRVFIESEKIKSGEIIDLAVFNDFQKLGKGLANIFKRDLKQ